MHHSFDLSIYPVNSTLKMLASLLERITTANDKLKQSIPEQDPPLVMTPAQQQIHTSFTRFHARSIPSISISAYLTRILKYCPCANECFLSLLVYFDRMARNVEEITGGEGRQFSIDSYNIHRLIIAGVMVSAKFFSDVFFTNSRYAKVGGLPVWELNQLELEFLTLNNFSLAISVEELQTYGDQLMKHWMCEEMARRGGPDQAMPAAAVMPPAGGADPTNNSSDTGSQRTQQDSRTNGHDRKHDGAGPDGAAHSDNIHDNHTLHNGTSHNGLQRQHHPQHHHHHHHHHNGQSHHHHQHDQPSRQAHGESSRYQPSSSSSSAQAQVQVQPAAVSSSRGSPSGYRSEQGARFDRGLPTPPPPQPQQYHGYDKSDPRQQPLPAADHRSKHGLPTSSHPQQAASSPSGTSSGRHGSSGGGSPRDHSRHAASDYRPLHSQPPYLPTPGGHHHQQPRSPSSHHPSPRHQHSNNPSVNTAANGYSQGPITPTELSRNGSRLAA